MTNILKPKNPNPNVTLTNNNKIMPLKNLISMNAVFRDRRLNWFNEPDSLMLQGKLFHPGEHSSNVEQLRQRRNRSVLYMSIAIISVFVFCWLPFITNELILVYRSSSTHFSCSFSLYYEVTFCIVDAYVALNPIICFTFSSNYRLGLKRPINSSSGVQK